MLQSAHPGPARHQDDECPRLLVDGAGLLTGICGVIDSPHISHGVGSGGVIEVVINKCKLDLEAIRNLLLAAEGGNADAQVVEMAHELVDRASFTKVVEE